MEGGGKKEFFFMGMRRTGVRRITEDEAAFVKRHMRRIFFMPSAVLAAYVTLIFFFAYIEKPIAVSLNRVYFSSGDIVMGALGMIFLLGGITIVLKFFLDAGKKYLSLRKDLSEGEVRTFEGRYFRSLSDDDKVLKEIEAERLIAAKSVNSFGVLPRSGTVVSINGDIPSGFYNGVITEADVNDKQYCSAPAAGELTIEGKRIDGSRQRHMSKDEIEEISSHIDDIRRQAGLVGLLCIFIVCIKTGKIIGKIQQYGYIQWVVESIFELIIIALNGFFLWLVAARLLFARALKKDCAAGMIIIANIEGDSLEYEILPISGTLWRVGDVPAHWRHKKTTS